MDLGVYPINASRYLFRDEPIEVTGIGANTGDPRFNEVHEMATGILRFPGDRLAILTCSFGAARADAYQVVGTKAELWLQPAYDYHEQLKLRLKTEEKDKETSFDKVDQFGAEIEYFSAMHPWTTRSPNLAGYEGLADIRIVEALLESMRSGRPVKLAPFEKKNRPGEQQKFEKSPVKPRKRARASAEQRVKKLRLEQHSLLLLSHAPPSFTPTAISASGLRSRHNPARRCTQLPSTQ